MLIFIYDNLLKNHINHFKIQNSIFIGNARSRDKYYMTSLTCNSYPVISYIPIFNSEINMRILCNNKNMENENEGKNTESKNEEKNGNEEKNTESKNERSPSYIKGEVYEVNNAILKELDTFYNHPDFYTREIIDVILESNEEFELSSKVYCYIIKSSEVMKDIRRFFTYTHIPIVNGDWRRFL